MSFVVGVDTGGTFTDAVIVDERGHLTFDKALSSPKNYTIGVLDSLRNCAQGRGLALKELLAQSDLLSYGTTVATNALIERKGVRVGLITSKGFEDTTIMMRDGIGRTGGLPYLQALDYIYTERPEPIPSKDYITGATERVDRWGKVISPLKRDEAKEAIKKLVDKGVESIACSFLWSFQNPAHEQEMKKIAAELYPDLFFSISSDIAPMLGEYERAMTVVLNSYLGPIVGRHVENLRSELRRQGLRNPVQIMQCTGGLLPAELAGQNAISILDSGPVGGTMAARVLGSIMGHENIISTDVGGTSFDVGIIARGQCEIENAPYVSQGLRVYMPTVEVSTIGAGGGSIAWTLKGRLGVGPQSAGADPGPVCYGKGGTEPTVTDAVLVLGYLNPENFFGARMKLDARSAEEAIKKKIADPLGLSVIEAAAGIYRIITAKMTDLIRKVTVERGYDPREFVLYGFGGAGPAHCSIYGLELGVKSVVVPYTAPVFSAMGIAYSDVRYNFLESRPMKIVGKITDEQVDIVNEIYQRLEQKAASEVRQSGLDLERATLLRQADIHYVGQVNELMIPVAAGRFDKAAMAEVIKTFEEIYEARYGKGSAYVKEGIEIMTFRVDAVVGAIKPEITKEPMAGPKSDHALVQRREAFFIESGGKAMTPVYDGMKLLSGNRMRGPAIIEQPTTTIVIHPGQIAHMDELKNIVIAKEA